MTPSRPVILCILDGWGISSAPTHNGIVAARTPTWDRFMAAYPHGQLQASERSVGLPHGQMGNSEVGHMTIGAGRVIVQDLPRIDISLEEGTFAYLPEFQDFVEKLKQTGGACHIMGLLSPGGVHSHQSHMEAIVKLLAAHGIPMHIHGILDGRDTPPQSALAYLQEFIANTNQPLATIGGRYFAMDRDKRWDRIALAYETIVCGQGPVTEDPIACLQDHYKQGIGDEFIPPHRIGTYAGMRDGDGLFMVNFRADRVRQVLGALLAPHFSDFKRTRGVNFGATLGLGEYSAELTPLIPALFPKERSCCQGWMEATAHCGNGKIRPCDFFSQWRARGNISWGRSDSYPLP
jgi:2,3-bisphosphoglycerate-independent phosphoglycerate mutase